MHGGDRRKGGFSGDVVVDLDRDAAATSIRELLDRGVEEFAISLLWSFANPIHELALEELVAEVAPQSGITVGHRIAPRLGEYPRAATAVFNAYIAPLMALADIVESHRPRGATLRTTTIRFVRHLLGRLGRCRGGENPPAADGQVRSGRGVVATGLLGEQCGQQSVIATDMGGTTLTSASSPAAARGQARRQSFSATRRTCA